ncbi:MAG: hypothetical protein GX541_08650 [Clostridiales bacterium]|nr:hypothetical protein [Clostridiales bacterium]
MPQGIKAAVPILPLRTSAGPRRTGMEIPILLCNIKLHELLNLKDILLSREGVYADCCGLKDSMTALEQLQNAGLTKRMVYGSLAPIFCLKSSLLVVEKSNISNEIKDGIFSGAGLETSIRAFEIT